MRFDFFNSNSILHFFVNVFIIFVYEASRYYGTMVCWFTLRIMQMVLHKKMLKLKKFKITFNTYQLNSPYQQLYNL